MRIITLIFLSQFFYSCNNHKQENKLAKSRPQKHTLTNKPKQNRIPSNQKAKSAYSFFTHLQPEGWGYCISENGKQIIDQQTIPGIPGNGGFQSSAEAQKVAELVIEKLEKHIFPPTISEEELKQLGISWTY